MKSIVMQEYYEPENIPQSNQIKQREEYLRSSLDTKKIFITEGTIKKSYSDQNCSDVEMTNGFLLPRVPVRSLEWVVSDGSSATGERDLPPVDAKVVIIFPDGIVDNAFILCSAFDPLSKGQDADFLVDGEEKTYLKINEQKWKTTYDKSTGDYLLESDSADTNTIKVTRNRTDEYVKIEVGSYLINIDAKNKKITLDADGVLFSLDNTGGAKKINFDDGTNTIVMDSTGVNINSGKLFVPA